MWDGRGIKGPRRDQYIEKYPALWGTMSLIEFLMRYSNVDDCEIFTGEEIIDTSEGCEAACANLGLLCTTNPNIEQTCLRNCSSMMQAQIDCLAALTSCDTGSCN